MKIGLCAGYDRAEAALAAGFDYLEPQVSATAAMSEEEFDAVCARMRALGMATPVFNVLFPGDMKLLADDMTEERLNAYLEQAFARVQRLGGQLVVFGSGRSRMRPESLPYEVAFRRLAAMTHSMGEAAARYDLMVVVEPLNRRECNMINTLGEGACLAAAAHHPCVWLLADHYHMALEQDPPEDISRVSGVLHTHIAAREGRRYLLEANAEIAGFIRGLRAAGYDGMMSVEGRTDDLAAEGPAALRVLRELWAEA